METITIEKKAFMDLARLAEELNDRLESLELMGDPEVMESHKRAKEQIKKRQLKDFNAL